MSGTNPAHGSVRSYEGGSYEGGSYEGGSYEGCSYDGSPRPHGGPARRPRPAARRSRPATRRPRPVVRLHAIRSRRAAAVVPVRHRPAKLAAYGERGRLRAVAR
ncbi:hypothetical protein GCM10010389_56060 [Streptomyces echinoruber]|uniref:Uncharacterized protein n=1 Tax=Streptomyces echinoruber TaxID=68898 RepID=A0A918RRQ1_9ACTN|nr:hypothetical protein GCM10010389_56060 [Streptomyces echinoruber]